MRQALWAAGAFVLAAALAVATLGAPPPDEARAALEEDELALATSGGGGARGGLSAPTWRVGDAWRVQFDQGDPLCWAVVVEADAEGYRQGLWCPDDDETVAIAVQLAGVDWRYLGAFSRELAATGASETTRFYEWPLVHGATWSTELAGRDVDVEARFDERSGRFVLEMTEDGDTLLVYDYDPQLRWWSAIEFASGYTFRVHERATGWERGAVYGVAEDRLRITLDPLSVPTLGDLPFEATDEDDRLYAAVQRAGTFFHRFVFRAPDGDPVWDSTDASQTNLVGAGGAGYQWRALAGEPGMWTIEDQRVAVGSVTYVVRGVALHEHPATR